MFIMAVRLDFRQLRIGQQRVNIRVMNSVFQYQQQVMLMEMDIVMY